MATVQLKFGPADHGRPVTADDLDDAEYDGGYKYEVIDGRLYVSPQPNMPENDLESWLHDHLADYAKANRDKRGRVTNKARVFVPDRPDLTVPEPDLAYYQPYPSGVPRGDLRWQDFTPLVVAEVLVDSDPDKDLVRNVELYFQVPGIAEYWILDGRESVEEPLLIARRRHRNRWIIREVPFGDTFSTRTLPGFEIVIDPSH